MKNILDVLGMSRTGFSYEVVDDRDVAVGYVRTFSAMSIAGRVLIDGRFFGNSREGYVDFHRFLVDGAPYGGLVGSISDLRRFMGAHLNGGEWEGRRILQPTSVAAMQAGQRDNAGHLMPVGLGWHLGGLGNARYIYHLGGGGGFKSELRIYPELRYGIAVLGNNTSYDTTAVTRRILSE